MYNCSKSRLGLGLSICLLALSGSLLAQTADSTQQGPTKNTKMAAADKDFIKTS